MCGLVIFLWSSAVVLKLVDFKNLQKITWGLSLNGHLFVSRLFDAGVEKNSVTTLFHFFFNISGVTYVDYRFIDLSTNKDIKIILKNNQKVYSKCSDKN